MSLGVRKRSTAHQGKGTKSVMLRVDLGFANAVRGLAIKHGRSVTEITRELPPHFPKFTKKGGK